MVRYGRSRACKCCEEARCVYRVQKAHFMEDSGFRENLRSDCFSLRAYDLNVVGGIRAKCVWISLCSVLYMLFHLILGAL